MLFFVLRLRPLRPRRKSFFIPTILKSGENMEKFTLLDYAILAFGAFVLYGLLRLLYRWIKYKQFISEINWKIFATEVRIKAELERWVLADNFTPISQNKILDEIRSNRFCDWVRVYLEPESLSCELPRSIWLIMKWLMLRQREATSRLAIELDLGDSAGLTTGNKFQLFMSNRNLPNSVYYASLDELDKSIQKLFPNITNQLVRYRQLKFLRQLYT
jgi:hypothetical protein